MPNPLHHIRKPLLRIFASIFTLAITILYPILKFLVLLPLPKSSYIHKDLLHSLNCCSANTNTNICLSKSLYLIINSTLSLLSALAIANYCDRMLGIVQWTSHKIHMVFLHFIIPSFPQIYTFTPGWIVHVYLGLGYIGVSSQLSLTLDLMYIYNLPAIYAYKLLAFVYSCLIDMIKFCLQVYQNDLDRWLTCPYPFLKKTKPINKFVAFGFVIVLSQILLIVGFYYLWLTLVILMLIFAINILRNMILFVYKLSQILLIIKGYQSQVNQSQQKLKILQRMKQIKFNWISLIKLKDIRDVFIGKDIIKMQNPTSKQNQNTSFSITKVYKSFISQPPS